MIILIEFFCLATASFFAGMETGLLSADKLKIYSKKQKKVFWAESANFLLEKPERLLGTTLIGTNVAVVTGTVLLNNYLRSRFSLTAAVTGSLALAVTYLLFSEIIPKTFFRRYADSITVKLAPVLRVFFFIFLPFSLVLNSLVKVLTFLPGRGKSSDKLPRSRDDFRLLMHLSSRESGFGYDDFKTIDDILDFEMTIASETMIPIHQYPLFNIEKSSDELIKFVVAHDQRFYPLYRDRSDNIVGYVDMEDFCGLGALTPETALREPVFFPEVKPLSDLLYTMVGENLPVIFLCDEYGGISGIITQQRIASEIIGAIPGSMNTTKEEIKHLEKNIYIAEGTTDLEYLSHVLNRPIRKGNNQTLGGYLCERMGVVPKAGDELVEKPLKYTVTDADKLQVRYVRIEVLSDNVEEKIG